MSDKIYGIDWADELVSIGIVRETDNFIYLEHGKNFTNYRKRLDKRFTRIHRTPQQAVNAWIKGLKQEISEAQRSLKKAERMKAKLEKE